MGVKFEIDSKMARKHLLNEFKSPRQDELYPKVVIQVNYNPARFFFLLPLKIPRRTSLGYLGIEKGEKK